MSEQQKSTTNATKSVKIGDDEKVITEGAGSKYERYNGMDKPNKEGMDVLASTGSWEETVKYMMTDQETGKPLSYAEMRSRYG